VRPKLIGNRFIFHHFLYFMGNGIQVPFSQADVADSQTKPQPARRVNLCIQQFIHGNEQALGKAGSYRVLKEAEETVEVASMLGERDSYQIFI
jgi:hypothetical protein